MDVYKGDCSVCKRTNIDIFDNDMCLTCTSIENLQKSVKKLQNQYQLILKEIRGIVT